jgi:transposase-like protein
MEADRWPNGVTCPLCGVDNVTKMGGETQAGMFMCNGCRGKFTVRTGTIFEAGPKRSSPSMPRAVFIQSPFEGGGQPDFRPCLSIPNRGSI